MSDGTGAEPNHSSDQPNSSHAAQQMPLASVNEHSSFEIVDLDGLAALQATAAQPRFADAK